jgi:hypothetical protein
MHARPDTVAVAVRRERSRVDASQPGGVLLGEVAASARADARNEQRTQFRARHVPVQHQRSLTTALVSEKE